jgi:hypothetical protein
MNGAGTAGADTAAVFGADQIKMIPQHPQNGGCRIDVHRVFFSVDQEGEGGHIFLFKVG